MDVGGEESTFKSTLDFIIERLLLGKIPDVHTRLQVLHLTGKKLAVRYILVVGHRPTYVYFTST